MAAITLKIGKKEWRMSYLTEEVAHYLRDKIQYLASTLYNPYPIIYEKISFLPPEDRAIAIKVMMEKTYPVPEEYIYSLTYHPLVVSWTLQLVAGMDQQEIEEYITEENIKVVMDQACAMLKKFKPKRIVFEGTPEEQVAQLEKLKAEGLINNATATTESSRSK